MGFYWNHFLVSLSSKSGAVSYVEPYQDSGFLVYQQNGESGKVCADAFERKEVHFEVDKILDNLGNSICSLLDFQKADSIEVIKDTTKVSVADDRYVDIMSSMSVKSFASSYELIECTGQNVVKISCQGLECGKNPLGVFKTQQDYVEVNHGDWPWHVTLFRDGQHKCDGTLISSLWVATSASCFKG